MRAVLLCALAATTLPSLAHAQEVASGDAEVEASRQVDRAQLEDPNVDRGMLLPTAQTQPKGSITFNDYELFLMGLSYGVTDNLQVTATTLVPITTDMPIFVLSNAKLRLVKQGRLRLSAIGGVGFFNEALSFDDVSPDEEFTTITVHGGAVASLCLSDDCHSLASASVTATRSFSDGESSDVAFIYGGSVVAKVAKRVKLVGEIMSGGDLQNGSFNGADGAILSAGVRFFSEHIAGDIGFMRPLGIDDKDGEDDGDFLLGIPFVSFTYRN
jgi:hypothetical protein